MILSKEAAAALEAMTGGKWTASPCSESGDGPRWAVSTGDDVFNAVVLTAAGNDEANARGIALIRNLLPEILRRSDKMLAAMIAAAEAAGRSWLDQQLMLAEVIGEVTRPLRIDT